MRPARLGKHLDELHRVVSATEDFGSAWRTYTYDSLGNLTWEENSNSVHYDYKLNSLNQLVEKRYSTNDKEGTVYSYDGRGNLVKEEYGKLNGNPNGQKRQTVAEYTYDESNRMVKGVNSIGESSSYLFNGKGALVEQTWHIAKNGYGYHDVDAGTEEESGGKGGSGSGGNGHGNGNGHGDKPVGSDGADGLGSPAGHLPHHPLPPGPRRRGAGDRACVSGVSEG